jgi:site-specific DNA recombinase
MPKQRRAIIYARISSDRADESGHVRGVGVADQERDARSLAKRLGWDVVRVVTENDTSAFKRKRITLPDGTRALRVVRPGFRSILDDLANDRADALIALDLDRALRDPRDLEDLIDVVEQHRIAVESVTGSLRLSTDADITMARVMVAVANKSSRDTGRRVARARLRSAEAGRVGGGKRMFGFEPDGMTVRPAEAEEIVSAAHRLLEGISVREITLDLRRREVPTVAGGRWTPASVRGILRRPRNAGIVVHKGARIDVQAAWEPIVSEEVHEAVLRVLNDPTRILAPGNTPRWLGSGLYRCACGGPMRVHGQGRYRCTWVAQGDVAGFGHTTIPAAPTDNVVEEVVIARLATPSGLDLFAPPAEGNIDAGKLRSESASLRARMTTLAEDYADGVLTREQLVAASKRVDGRLREVEDQLTRSVGRSPLTPLLGSRDVRRSWAGLTIAAKRSIVAAIVQVDIRRATLGKAFDPERVAITWKV